MYSKGLRILILYDIIEKKSSLKGEFMKNPATHPMWPNIFMLSILIFSIIVSVFFIPIVMVIHYLTTGSDLHIPAWVGLVVSQVGIIGIPCAIYLIINRKRIKDILPFRRLGWKNWLFVIGMSIAIYPIGQLLNVATSMIFGSPIQGTMEEIMHTGGIWLMLALFPILPSIFEEVALRGIVFSGYKKVKIFTAAMVNGLFFGILHQNFNQFSYAFLLGVFMCYFMYYTKSIWAPVISHVVINAIGSLLMFLMGTVDLDEAYYAYTQTEGFMYIWMFMILGFIAVVFTGIFIWIYISFRNHNLRRNEAEGIVTDEHAAAVANGEPIPRVLSSVTFWSVVGLGLALMIIMQIFMARMV